MKCPLCKSGMKPSFTSLPYEIGDDRIVVIRNVPAIICRQCGEFFIEIPIVRIVEKIVSSAKENGIMLGFVQYKQAA